VNIRGILQGKEVKKREETIPLQSIFATPQTSEEGEVLEVRGMSNFHIGIEVKSKFPRRANMLLPYFRTENQNTPKMGGGGGGGGGSWGGGFLGWGEP